MKGNNRIFCGFFVSNSSLGCFLEFVHVDFTVVVKISVFNALLNKILKKSFKFVREMIFEIWLKASVECLQKVTLQSRLNLKRNDKYLKRIQFRVETCCTNKLELLVGAITKTWRIES